ncbi:DEAD/DEAH box helicase domain containing protein [Acanthamoeba castellanii str. Neff]|uniref:ATP-dependent RNA helicase n=1 Tax=Acanthamoeba castellanii (strain ATCC 30010 / Neff) TaxID=1257118 RepID=L8H0E6_ACACF|nr:DEAD/DEAH box helicase domain containing protein [Acanthamoeba castellanii str. Neff]ELR18238.1 DEAD/DEAH box helicase domain containing protein [Acanthamoeba castellanii str. Neff]
MVDQTAQTTEGEEVQAAPAAGQVVPHRPSGLYGEVTNKGWDDVTPALSAGVMDIITNKLGFNRMTPVQAGTIPLFLSYKDVCVECDGARQACTGSGKTLAFLVPLFEMLLRREDPLKKHEVGALIITPTRELASQITEIAKVFIENLKGTPGKQSFTLQVFIGGVELSHDMRKFQAEGGHVIIGTPGRLEDIINKMDHVFNTRSLEVLVLDEADRLLEMGFRPQINTILNRLPKQRRTGLFSATQTQEVEHLARAGLRNPLRVGVKVRTKGAQVKNQKIPLTLTNWYMTVESDEKLAQLCHFITTHSSQKIIVYFLTCACVDYIYRALTVLKKSKAIPEDFEFLSLHGKVPQQKRPLVFNKFVSEKNGCALLATDLAARGLDVPDVDWIIQYDPPQDPDTFVHRIGRSAHFMKYKGVPFREMEKATDVMDVIPIVRQAATKDRELMEKSKLAFVSFVRGYKEHHYKYIFVFERLNLGKLAMAFSLLRLPSMPETRNKKVDDFTPVEIELSAVPYTDKKKEKQRKIKLAKSLKEEAEKRAKVGKKGADVKNSAPWSRNQLKKEKRDKRKMLKDNKRKRIEEVRMGLNKNGDGDDDDDDGEEDWKELENDLKEERLLKKLKRGKISKAEFEKRTGERDLEEEFESELAKEAEVAAQAKATAAAAAAADTDATDTPPAATTTKKSNNKKKRKNKNKKRSH